MARDVNSYLQDVIGQPWSRHGAHCWALVEDAQRELFDRQVPPGPAHVPGRATRTELLAQDPGSVGWQEVEAPEHGAVVRFSRAGGNMANAEHAGVFLAMAGGRILHSDCSHGVVLDTLPELRVRGWVPRYYVPKRPA